MPRNKSRKSTKTFSKINIEWGVDELQLPTFAMAIPTAPKPQIQRPFHPQSNEHTNPWNNNISNNDDHFDDWRRQQPKEAPSSNINHKPVPHKQPNDNSDPDPRKAQKENEMKGNWRSSQPKMAPTLPKISNNGKYKAPRKSVAEVCGDSKDMNRNWRRPIASKSRSGTGSKWRPGGFGATLMNNNNTYSGGKSNDINKWDNDVSDSGDSVKDDHCMECMGLLDEVKVTECVLCYQDIKQKMCIECGWNDHYKEDAPSTIMCPGCKEASDDLYPDDNIHINIEHDIHRQKNDHINIQHEEKLDPAQDGKGLLGSCKKCDEKLYETAVTACFECYADISYKKLTQMSCNLCEYVPNESLFCDTCQIMDVWNKKWRDNKPKNIRRGRKRKKHKKKLKQQKRNFNDDIINKLVALGVGSREQIKRAKLLVEDDDDINVIADKVLELRPNSKIQLPDKSASNDENKEQRDHLDMMEMMELSRLEAGIKQLYQIKLQRARLFAMKGHIDYKQQHQKEQATIMDMVDMLNNMKEINTEYYREFLKKNEWAANIMNRSVDIHNGWDAFN